MKYMKLWGSHISMSRTLNFKWEWSVHWERRKHMGNSTWVWKPEHVIVESRRVARVYAMAHKQSYQDRNVRIMRRRVQVDWESYDDE